MNVQVSYKTGDRTPWSEAPSKKIPVGTGTTTLNWNIQLIPALAGTIAFNTDSKAPAWNFSSLALETAPGREQFLQVTATVTRQISPACNPVQTRFRITTR